MVEVGAHAGGVEVHGRFVGFFMGLSVHEDYYYNVVADVAFSLQLLRVCMCVCVCVCVHVCTFVLVCQTYIRYRCIQKTNRQTDRQTDRCCIHEAY